MAAPWTFEFEDQVRLVVALGIIRRLVASRHTPPEVRRCAEYAAQPLEDVIDEIESADRSLSARIETQ